MERPLTASPTKYYPEIDSLRGLAAYLVLWFHTAHAFVRFQPEITARGTLLFDVAWLLDWGRAGVVTFFIISGFVVPSSLKGPTTRALVGFAIKRFWRLYPVFWLVTLAAWAAFTHYWSAYFDDNTLLANLTMLPSFFNKPFVLGQAWTLEVELIFYALCALVYALGWLHKPAWAALVTASGIATGFTFPGYADHGFLQEILFNLGLMHFGLLFRAWADRGRRHDWISLTLVLSALALLALFTRWTLQGLHSGDEFSMQKGLGHLVGFLIFIAGATRYRMHNGFTAFLAKISYSVYLVHTVVHCLLQQWLLAPATPPAFRQQHLWVYLAANFVITTLLAWLLFRWIETPANRLGHRLARGR